MNRLNFWGTTTRHQRAKRLNIWVVACLIHLILAGCAVQGLQSPSQRRPYDREASSLHPNLTLHRKAQSSEVDVYLQIPRSELLYSRTNAQAPFVADVRLQTRDTTWALVDTAWSNSPPLLRHKWTLSSVPIPTWEEFTVIDVQRNALWSTNRYIGPKEEWGSNDILVWNQSTQWPESGEHVAIGDTLHLHLPKTMSINRMDAVMWELSNAPAPSNLPPPPYSSARLRLDTIRPSQMGTLQADSLIVLVIPDGTTMLQLQGSNLTLRFHGRSKNFPALFSAEDLISPLRYIASRTEFQKLQQAEHPKMALDEFWLACGGSPEATRGLLQTYYDRVEEANLSFSGLTEGWRTDRGMVHIVFGVPQRIRRDSWNEYWIYGEEGTANALTFHFRRRSTPLDDNFFELQRSLQYRTVWDRGISNWRNGRVRGD